MCGGVCGCLCVSDSVLVDTSVCVCVGGGWVELGQGKWKQQGRRPAAQSAASYH